MKLQFDHHLPRSQRPDWLLLFVALASTAFDRDYAQNERSTVLTCLSSLLDEQVIVKRTQRIPGKNIKREIIDHSRMVVYSHGWTRPYLTISFVEQW